MTWWQRLLAALEAASNPVVPVAPPAAPLPPEPPRTPFPGQVAAGDAGGAQTPPETHRITPDMLQRLGAGDPDGWAPILDGACQANGITTPLRQAAFLATVMHESAGLTSLVESLNYRADRLLAVFGAGRISEAQAVRFGRVERLGRTVHPADQEAIANQVYGGDWGRRNLGNTQPGDGWKFRGRGIIQITGRSNYTDFATLTRRPLESLPALLETRQGAADSAAAFWTAKGCNALADTGDIRAVRTRVNGGVNGLEDVTTRYEDALALIDGG